MSLKNKNKKMEKGTGKGLLCILFWLYIILVLRITVFRSSFSPDNLMQKGIVNFTLFEDYVPLIRNGDWYRFIYLFFGNIVWFIPFGMYLRYTGRIKNIFLITGIGFLFSLMIESLQYVFGTGYSELDDLVLNTLGVWIGAVGMKIVVYLQLRVAWIYSQIYGMQPSILIPFMYQQLQGGHKMDFNDKLLTLRKGKDLTQEQLAERLDVSRQSVSKWESGQAVPELDKIIALSNIFDVTTDYLLKPSEIDELSVKTQILEQQQKALEYTIQKKEKKKNIILCCTAIYLIAFAIMMLVEQISWEVEFLWNIFPGMTFPMITLLIATAIAIFICRKYAEKK